MVTALRKTRTRQGHFLQYIVAQESRRLILFSHVVLILHQPTFPPYWFWVHVFLFPGSKAIMLRHQASSCETSCDLLFFFSIRLTYPVRNAFDVKRKKKGWPNPKPQTWRSKLSRKKQGQGLTVPMTHVRQIFSVAGKRLGEPCYPLSLHLLLRK